MSKVLNHYGPLYPLFCPMGPTNAISASTFNHKTSGFKDAENGVYSACTFLGGWDVIEKYISATVWPLSHWWKKPAEIIYLTVDWASDKVPFP